MTTVAQLDTSKLLDHLLDARCAMRAAQDLSKEGAPIYKSMQSAIKHTDDALRTARVVGKATKT